MLHRVTTGRIGFMVYTRDPVSEAFDGAARRLLDRVYAQRGQWVAVWLPDPTIRQRTRYIGAGINVDGPDPLPAGGGVNARSRWARGFVRALYYQHRYYSPMRSSSGWKRRTSLRASGGLRVEVGRHVAASPQFDPQHPERGGFPARRRVRVMLAAGGRKKDAAVARLSDKDRIYQRDGSPADRFSHANGPFRDWA
jgi:hypothetical protein